MTRFANVIAEDDAGQIWRVSPDALEARVLAASEADFNAMMRHEEDNTDVFMAPLVALATAELGSPGPGRSFYLVIPSALGGDYDIANIKIAPTIDIISMTGIWAGEIASLPDGAQVRLRVID